MIFMPRDVYQTTTLCNNWWPGTQYVFISSHMQIHVRHLLDILFSFTIVTCVYHYDLFFFFNSPVFFFFCTPHFFKYFMYVRLCVCKWISISLDIYACTHTHAPEGARSCICTFLSMSEIDNVFLRAPTACNSFYNSSGGFSTQQQTLYTIIDGLWYTLLFQSR